jgi:hypothetical protein
VLLGALLSAGSLALVPAVATAAPASSVSYYVSTSGSSAACSQATPCASIAQAINDALTQSNTAVTINVAAGTYHESLLVLLPASDTLTIAGAAASTTILNDNGGGTDLELQSGIVTVNNLSVVGGSSTTGGGVLDIDSNLVTFNNDTISGNTATSGSGGNVATSGANLAVNDSTISGGTANTSGGGLDNANSNISLTNDTIFGNTSNGASGGGLADAGGSAFLNEVTIAHNSGGGIDNTNGGVNDLTPTGGSIGNSILAANGTDCAGGLLGDQGYNVADDASCGLGGASLANSSSIGTLGLAANGSTGPQTAAIANTSSAFALVPPAACSPATDERGLPRPGTDVTNCDAGAFEFQGAPQAVTITSPAPSPVAGGATYTPTATGGGSGNPITFSVDPTSGVGVCTVTAGVVAFTGSGTCVIDATQPGNATYLVGSTSQSIMVAAGTQTITFPTSGPTNAVVGATYDPLATGGGSGNPVLYSSSTLAVCTVSGNHVNLIAVGSCTVDANQAGNASFAAAPQVQQSFTIGQGSQAITFVPNTPPLGEGVGDSYTVGVTVGASGTPPVFTSGSPAVCTADPSSGLYNFVGAGTCVVLVDQAGNANYTAAPQAEEQIGVAQGVQGIVFTSAAPAATISGPTYNPTATGGASGNPVVFSIDGASTAGACSIAAGVVSFAGLGTCIIDANQAGNVNYLPAAQNAQSVAVGPTPHGYWLVGTDGGIFTFGSARFYGSTGNLHLNRSVVGFTPTSTRNGYWLVASDGGIFAFGDAGFYGSIPGLGLAPAGSPLPNRLNAPVVGMVPSTDGLGYFMVAADGGVFAFGDAKFEGSCPGIGGCAGAAVSVVPDASGNGYWVVTSSGHVYAFGDAVNYGAPGQQNSPVASATRTGDGNGYWILLANGTVESYGDATNMGGPSGSVSASNPATTIFAPSIGGGYWVASKNGSVFSFGAPFYGSVANLVLNGSIIAASGF